jgi:predicted tellurium resistance membrane protein TerC
MSLRAILLFGFVVLGLAAVAADSPGPDVQVETTDKHTVTGRLTNETIKLKTDYGTQDIDPHVISRIAFSPPDSPGHDVIEFTDGNHARGDILTERFVVQEEQGIQSFSAKAIREIKMPKPKQLGFWAIALGLITLAAMEIVLGIDNIIFLAIVTSKLPEAQQPEARRLGLIAALGTRILLLFTLSYLLGLTKPLFTVPDLPYFHDLEAREVSIRDLILIAGGLFLIYKSVKELHERLEASRNEEAKAANTVKTASFGGVLLQIAVLDIVFSLDSVITAVGMVDILWVMITAMVIAMLVMMVFAGRVSRFVSKHPTIKVLALAFLILIGVMLVAESLGQHIDKGYIYFAMAFAVVLEMINLRIRKPKGAAPAPAK